MQGVTDQTAQIVLHTIRQRRTIDLLKLKPDPVPQDVLEAILTAGTWAPTHGKHQPWRFTVFMGEGRRQLADLFARAYAASTAKDASSPEAQASTRARRRSGWGGTNCAVCGVGAPPPIHPCASR